MKILSLETIQRGMKIFPDDSLSYNLLSVSQLCEMSYNCLFSDKGVEVFRREDSSIVFMGQLKNKLYLVDSTKVKLSLRLV